LRMVHDAAIAASQPAAIMHRHVPPTARRALRGDRRGQGRCGGQRSMPRSWRNGAREVPVSGVVATRYGHAAGLPPPARIAVVEAGHPTCPISTTWWPRSRSWRRCIALRRKTWSSR
jgi:hydroxypyruvate reductase